MHFVLAEGVPVVEQARRQLQQLVLATQIVIDAGYIGWGNLGKLFVLLQFLEVLQRQLVLAIHILDVGIVVEAGVAVLRLAAHLLGEVARGLFVVAQMEVAVAHFEIVLAAMVVFHLAGIDLLVPRKSRLVRAAGIVEVAQVETRHVATRTLGVESQKLLQAVAGIVVVQLLGADTCIVVGVGRRQVRTVLRTLGDFVVYLLCGSVLLFPIEVHGLTVKFALPAFVGHALGHRFARRQGHQPHQSHNNDFLHISIFKCVIQNLYVPHSRLSSFFIHGPRSSMPLAGAGV